MAPQRARRLVVRRRTPASEPSHRHVPRGRAELAERGGAGSRTRPAHRARAPPNPSTQLRGLRAAGQPAVSLAHAGHAEWPWGRPCRGGGSVPGAVVAACPSGAAAPPRRVSGWLPTPRAPPAQHSTAQRCFPVGAARNRRRGNEPHPVQSRSASAVATSRRMTTTGLSCTAAIHWVHCPSAASLGGSCRAGQAGCPPLSGEGSLSFSKLRSRQGLCSVVRHHETSKAL